MVPAERIGPRMSRALGPTTFSIARQWLKIILLICVLIIGRTTFILHSSETGSAVLAGWICFLRRLLGVPFTPEEEGSSAVSAEEEERAGICFALHAYG